MQSQLLARHAGVARFAYNWGLEKIIAAKRAGVKLPTARDLHRELNRLKASEFPWMYEVSKCSPQEALWDLGNASKNFLQKGDKLVERARRKGKKSRKDGLPWGFPRFKSRKKGIGSFRLTGHIHLFQDAVQLPRIGKVQLKEKGYPLREGMHILWVTISERAGRWYMSLQVEEEIEIPENHGPAVGIDLGILRLITVSDGTFIENPKGLARYDRKRRRLQRSAARRKPGSNNRSKVNRKIACCNARIANIRKDAIHKATTMLARTKSAIGVETLGIEGMMASHRIAGSLADAGLGEILRQLGYKSDWYGSHILRAKRSFPSTQRCSSCKRINPKMPLSLRWFKCIYCGFEADRDLNSALNLQDVAVSCTETVNACESREVHGPDLVWDQVPGIEAGTISPDRALEGAESHISRQRKEDHGPIHLVNCPRG